jgi:hypothetical protein
VVPICKGCNLSLVSVYLTPLVLPQFSASKWNTVWHRTCEIAGIELLVIRESTQIWPGMFMQKLITVCQDIANSLDNGGRIGAIKVDF